MSLWYIFGCTLNPDAMRQVARIDTEKLLQLMVEKELTRRKREGSFKGKFACLTHYFGYEGRCSLYALPARPEPSPRLGHSLF